MSCTKLANVFIKTSLPTTRPTLNLAPREVPAPPQLRLSSKPLQRSLAPRVASAIEARARRALDL